MFECMCTPFYKVPSGSVKVWGVAWSLVQQGQLAPSLTVVTLGPVQRLHPVGPLPLTRLTN